VTYIINALISGFYILKGAGTIISVKSNDGKLKFLQKITSLDFLNEEFPEIMNFLDKAVSTAQSVLNIVNLYVYGLPSLFVGLFALALSSMGVFLLTKKQTQTTVGYYITMVFSFLFLILLTLIYAVIAVIISRLKR
ncbi:MAG: hypothetical protein K2K91_11650, partial [Ruminococcus sp.]|nr:hypothetical protein [Ruminococcus sp.]